MKNITKVKRYPDDQNVTIYSGLIHDFNRLKSRYISDTMTRINKIDSDSGYVKDVMSILEKFYPQLVVDSIYYKWEYRGAGYKLYIVTGSINYLPTFVLVGNEKNEKDYFKEKI
jgi:hypothetical protein